VSLFPFSLSSPLVGGERAVLSGVILLLLNTCGMPVFQTLEILTSWELSFFFDSCGLPDFVEFQTLHGLLVFCASCSLLDSYSLPDSCSLPNFCSLPDSQGSYIYLEKPINFKGVHIHNHQYTF
jgi:hypothetical protein